MSAFIIMNQKFIEGLLGLLQALLILGLVVALMLKGRELIPKERGEAKEDGETPGRPHARRRLQGYLWIVRYAPSQVRLQITGA